MPKLQEKLGETAGNGLLKVSMLRGLVFARSLRGKVFTFDSQGHCVSQKKRAAPGISGAARLVSRLDS